MSLLSLINGGHAGAKLVKFWNDLSSSYWFIPAIMALLAALLSIGMVLVDNRAGPSLLDDFPWLYINRAEGARAVLSTIAGSMITVAGVVFSITIASVVYASSQYGPRILGNYMSNRGNQVTMGTFIATFVYCLLILRTVRSAGEEEELSSFVPHLSLIVGIALAICSVGVLIYFIHHVPDSIHLPNVVASIGRDLIHQIERLYPDEIGAPMRDVPSTVLGLPDRFFDEAIPVRATATGYLQAIDGDQLLSIAGKYDLLLRVEFRPGNFMSPGQRLALAWPPGRVTDEVVAEVQDSFAWGRQRTALQDVLFPTDELVEIAARALSPGVNDPYTAMNCLDWLSNGLLLFSRRNIPNAYRRDSRGRLRVISYPVTFTNMVDAVFGQLLPYVRKDRNAALHMMKTLATLADSPVGRRAPASLLKYAMALSQTCTTCFEEEHDRKEIEERYRVVARLLRDHEDHREIVEENRWIEGGA